MKLRIVIIIAVICTLFNACKERKQVQYTPWGTPMVGDSIVDDDGTYGLSDIVGNGEMIMLTVSGPETYYDYHGAGMGLQYLLCEHFAQRLGVSLRVDVCKDTTEMMRKLSAGDADVVAVPLPRSTHGRVKGVLYTKVCEDSASLGWAVNSSNRALADSLNHWFKSSMVAEVRKQESFLLSTRSIRRHVYSPMLDRAGGVISRYDKYFMMYAPLARVDWRLMAAQCYQESCFDPNAQSWAGACGLMQIMPRTADHLGLSRSELFNPEANIAASARYLQELGRHYEDVPVGERVYFQIASYNGGFFHIRDAMALARKHGRNPHRWDDVSEFILLLSNPQYYTDPVVRYGYMRGRETVDYVNRIRDRYAQYRGVAHRGSGSYFPDPGSSGMRPERARKNYKWHL